MRGVLVAAALSVLAAGSVAAAGPATRPRIAVAEFDLALSGRTLPPADLGSSAAQAMVDRLVSSGAFQVYDAQWLARRQRDGRTDLDQMRAAAERVGIDYLALGTITQFSEEQSHRRIGGAVPRVPVLGGTARRTAQLLIGVLVKLVDVRSGEIVTTATGVGAASRTNINAGALGFFHLPGAGAYSRGSDSSRDAQLGEAMQRSIDLASQGLVHWRQR